MPNGKEGFFTPENLKKWSMDLSNACGGAIVIKSKVLRKPEPRVANMLLEEFVVAYNEQLVIMNEESKEEEE